MPVFNGEKYIGEAIESVLNQTWTDFELLIVNDGSTDNTAAVIASYNDKRIKLVNQQNAGVSGALNTGLKEAVGEYIARFDADDICYSNRLDKQYKFMLENPQYILIGSDVDYINEEGDFIFNFKNTGHTNSEINETFMQNCPFVHSSVFYRKDVVIELGGYETKAHSFEDYFLWVKLIKRGMVCNFAEPLIKVRFNPSSVTIDEKDHGLIFVKLKEKALITGIITDEEGEIMDASLKKLNKSKKEASYNRMLGKKYLWNNYQPAKARKHLIKSIRKEPLKVMGYALLLLSLLPEKFISWIYNVRN